MRSARRQRCVGSPVHDTDEYPPVPVNLGDPIASSPRARGASVVQTCPE
ncbi:hypothetical protein HMPREF9057_02538 [Actinomyces sp. oral taxon 171 str. F0337]|nr:hypothetical protein HMPREF9057_02538 [Actinomyces sp. oral taxon 171 str. F0337]